MHSRFNPFLLQPPQALVAQPTISFSATLNLNIITPPTSGRISPQTMALVLPVAASMIAWSVLYFFTWAFTVSKLERSIPPIVHAYNEKFKHEAKAKKKTVAGDVFDVQNRIVSIMHALVCIAVTAHQIREEGIVVGATNTQLQVPPLSPCPPRKPLTILSETHPVHERRLLPV